MTPATDLATGYLGAFTGNDPDAIAAFVSEGFRNEHLSELGSGCVGRDEYRRRIPHFLEAFSDRMYSIDDLVEQRRDAETDVVVRYRFTAVHDESGRHIEIPGVMWFTVSDGEIVRRTDTWDSLTFLDQIGQRPDF